MDGREEGMKAGSLVGKIIVPRRRMTRVGQNIRGQFQEVGGFL